MLKSLTIALVAIVLAHHQYPVASCILRKELDKVPVREAAAQCYKITKTRKQ